MMVGNKRKESLRGSLDNLRKDNLEEDNPQQVNLKKDNMPRVALVTGASKGIGRAVAQRLARDGYRVVVNYMSSQQAAEETDRLITEDGGQALVYKADVAVSAEVDAMVNDVLQLWGGIDVVVNNSGIMLDNFIEDVPDEEWDRVMGTNLNSVFYVCRAVIPHLKSKRYGRIINISSQAALSGSSGHGHYAAAKAGILGFSYSLAKELGPFGITVNIVSPGRIVTDMITSRDHGRMEEWIAATPLRRLGDTKDIADAVSFIASDQAEYITGLNMHVNGGLVMG